MIRAWHGSAAQAATAAAQFKAGAEHHAEAEDYRARTRLRRSGRPDPKLTLAAARQRPVRRNGTQGMTKPQTSGSR
jgi:hypothetical protein